MKYKGKYKYKVIFHYYILSDHTRILLLLFLLLTVLAEPTHRLKKSTFELFYKYFLQYDHLIMLESSVTMKSDGMHISRPACSPSWRISNATTSYMVFLAGFRIFSSYRKRDVWAFAITTESELRLWVELCKLPTLASKNPSINWYICKISTTDIADTWHNNVGHSLAHEHRQGHVISRILSIGMRMQGIFGSFVRVWTWIWRKTSSCL